MWSCPKELPDPSQYQIPVIVNNEVEMPDRHMSHAVQQEMYSSDYYNPSNYNNYYNGGNFSYVYHVNNYYGGSYN